MNNLRWFTIPSRKIFFAFAYVFLLSAISVSAYASTPSASSVPQYVCLGGICGLPCPQDPNTGSLGEFESCSEVKYYNGAAGGNITFLYATSTQVGVNLVWQSQYNGTYISMLYQKNSGQDVPSVDRNLGFKGCPRCGGTMLGNPVNIANGNKYQEESDYEGFGAFPLTFNRYYNSEGSGSGDAGVRWTHTFSRMVVMQTAAEVKLFRDDGEIRYFQQCGTQWCATADETGALSETVDGSGNITGWIYVDENVVTEYYDAAGRFLSEINGAGFSHALTYDHSGRLGAVADSFGRTLTFSYNTSNQLQGLTEPDGAAISYAYDAAGNLSSVTYPGGNSRTYFYNEPANVASGAGANLLTGVQDEAGSRYATYQYDGQSRAIDGEHAVGAGRIQITYNPDGSATVLDGLGSTRTYKFQTTLNVNHIASVEGLPCQACGLFSTYTYNASGDLSSTVDFNGNATTHLIDAAHLEEQRIDASGNAAQRTTSLSWNGALRVPLTRTVQDANGNLVSNTQWVYNANGQTLARCAVDPSNSAASGYSCSATGTVPAGVRRTTDTYCTAVDTVQCPLVGLLLTTTGPRTDLTQTTAYSYYMASSAVNCGTPGAACYQPGDLHTVTDALGHVTTIASYDADGRITRLTDANGINTDLTYYPRGWLKTRTVGGAQTSFTYTAYGAVQTLTDPDGVTTTYGYDAAHRLTKITDALGNTITYTLDAAGDKTGESVYDASGTLHKSLTRTFNTLGQLTSVVDGLNHTVFNATASTSYDANGNLVQSSDALGIQRQLGYDALNRLVQTLDNYNGTDTATQNTKTAYQYDSLDRLTQVTDPSSLNTTYSYDGLSDATGQQSPDTGTTSRTFDAAGNVLTRTDAKGIVATNTYDALDRLTSTSYPDSTQTITYTYDEANSVTGCSSSNPVGRLTRIIENTVTTAYCFDAWGRVIQKQIITGATTHTVGYSYTAAGRLSGLVSPDGSLVSYARDGDGRIQSLSTTPPNGTATTVVSGVTYQPFGPVSGYTLGNGQAITRTVDANYRLTDLTSPAFSLHVARDAMGDITAIGNASGANPATETYSYDPLYRLTAVTEANGSVLESVTYNQTGDRLSKTGSGLDTGAYGYTPNTHQLVTIGNSTLTVDANGNTTAMTQAGSAYGFGYNDRNRMAVAQLGGSTLANYTYDALGQRIQKVANGQTESYVYNEAGQLLAEYGATNRDYLWMDGIPVANIDTANGSSTITYVTADQLGTPRAIADASGNTVWQLPYQGNPWAEQQPTSNGYTYNLRFPGQYFDSETGLSYNVNRDYDSSTGRYIESDPTGLVGGINSYAAVSSSPLNRIDPDGLRDIFVGGFGDGTSGIVQSYYNNYHQNNPDSAYYSWTDLNGILQDIANTPAGDPINLIGHSYGGDTAATAAQESCRKVNLLITIDPVSRFHNFNMQAIENAVGTWVDVDAEGNNPFQPSNFIAGIGDAWDGAPNGIADSYIQDNGVNHEDFQSMMNASGPGVNSPAQVLAGSPTVSAPFLFGR